MRDTTEIPINFKLKLFTKKLKQKGLLKYNYVPFRNLMDDKGELQDFTTKDLKYSLKNPVEMSISESYDGSVDIILTDDLNPPRLINSRFTTTEDKQYEIIDRSGDKDSNLYSEESINTQTRLFKTSDKPLGIELDKVTSGGILKVGNYKFYFKYSDVDGNETKFIEESNAVSIFFSQNDKVYGGQLKQITDKLIKFNLTNVDTSYHYLHVYFSITSGEHDSETTFYKIINKYNINNTTMELIITGYENMIETTIDILNLKYETCDTIKTQCQIQNMMFFGNINKNIINYKELEDLSLRIYPTLYEKQIDKIDFYTEPKNIYSNVGYCPGEIYRFGVIYVMEDDTETSVFNITGYDLTQTFNTDILSTLYDNDNNRNFIKKTETGFYDDNTDDLTNQKGIVRIKDEPLIQTKDSSKNNITSKIYGITFTISPEIKKELKKNKVKFLKIVRQKRIPLLLMQGLSTCIDKFSYLPTYKEDGSFKLETLLNSNNELENSYEKTNLSIIDKDDLSIGLICPELYNNTYLQSIFTKTNNVIKPQYSISHDRDEGILKIKSIDPLNNKDYKPISLTYIPFGTSIKFVDNHYFSSMAGSPEDPADIKYGKFSNSNGEIGQTDDDLLEEYSTLRAYNKYIVRGYTTPYLATSLTTKYITPWQVYNIYISDYSENKMKDYFTIRANTENSYHSISPFISITDDLSTNTELICFNGDVFVSLYYYRTQTGFQDNEFPLQSEFIDKNNFNTFYTPTKFDLTTLKEDKRKGENAKNYLPSGYDNTQLNRADVNHRRFGIYVAIPIMSNYNLNLRSVDERNLEEMVTYKSGRSFYPLEAVRINIKESTLFNTGYNSILSPISYYLTPDVPYIKHLFNNRIMFSMKKTSDGFSNPNRLIHTLAFQDYGMEYGSITKILNWNDNLLVVFENGIGLLPINERSLIPSEGESISIYGSNVLPAKPQMISVDYGSRWIDSIIEIPGKIYGVDTEAKKIWRLSANGFEIISDFKIQKFLNDKLKLDERTYKPTVGLCNVKTHYNAYKQDIMFTFYNNENIKVLYPDNDVAKNELTKYNWNLCFNEPLNRWITTYTWTPLASENINNLYFSFDQKHSSVLSAAACSSYDNEYSFGITADNVMIDNDESKAYLKLSKNIEESYKDFTAIYSIINIDNYITVNDNTIGRLINDEGGYYIAFDPIIFTDDFINSCIENNIEWRYFTVNVNVDFYKDYNNHRTFFGNYQDTLVFIPDSSYYSETIIETIVIDGVTLRNTSYLDIHKKFFAPMFWKHGQSGNFYENDFIKYTKWYGRQEPFEFEFIINDNANYHKIFENLYIISNNAEPKSISYEIVGDSYFFSEMKENIYKKSNNDENLINFAYDDKKQLGTKLQYDKRLEEYKIIVDQPIVSIDMYKEILNGDKDKIIRANSQYQEDKFIVQIPPITISTNNGNNYSQALLKDKYIKIRVRYTGVKPVIIQAIQSIYNISIA